MILNLVLIIFTILQDTISIISSVISIKVTGKVYNIISAVFSFGMWAPQIYETYKIKKNAALSIPSLFLHAIGCGITIVYQFIYNNQGIWIILCYIVAFLCEFLIVFMCLYYKKKYKRQAFLNRALLTDSTL